ncbi:MAG: chloride channel protein [Gammaproteobacteria bacterium]|nr:chloride channel protein [Gammaproteobacteria bacterium]MCW5583071.1 chloride channel protein [Gammaproteobacteria bacterium]
MKHHWFIVILLSFVVGILGALAALIFQGMISLAHNLFFSGQLSFTYHQTVHTTPSIWGIGIIIIPVIGSFIVIWATKNYAPSEKGLSVPELIYAIRFKSGIINPATAVVKVLASAITIGTGGSVGREGPIIAMGSALSYLMSQMISLSPHHRVTLLAASSAAIISTTFNAPLAGIAFAIEVLLIQISFLNIVAIVVASMVAIYSKYLFIHVTPIFQLAAIPPHDNYYFMLDIILSSVILGILAGSLSSLFIRGLYWCEDVFKSLFENLYLRHALGMGAVGIMMYQFMIYGGHYHIEGIGFATIQDILNMLLQHPQFLILLFFGKLLATFFTLGSGGVGGILSPSLFLGAILGALVNLMMSWYFPSFSAYFIPFVMAGMASMLAGNTSAIVTSILLVMELTHDNSAILIISLTAIIAWRVRLLFCRDSAYTLKLTRRGILLK